MLSNDGLRPHKTLSNSGLRHHKTLGKDARKHHTHHPPAPALALASRRGTPAAASRLYLCWHPQAVSADARAALAWAGLFCMVRSSPGTLQSLAAQLAAPRTQPCCTVPLAGSIAHAFPQASRYSHLQHASDGLTQEPQPVMPCKIFAALTACCALCRSQLAASCALHAARSQEPLLCPLQPPSRMHASITYACPLANSLPTLNMPGRPCSLPTSNMPGIA